MQRLFAVLVIGMAVLLSPSMPSAYASGDDGEERLSRAERMRQAEMEALRISQEALGRKIRNGRFIDSRGQEVWLYDLLDKPLVINFIYTSCHSFCPTLTQSLSDAIRMAQNAFGNDTFHVLTIGFDVGNDTPEAMRRFARSQGAGGGNWRFLSGDLEDVARLSDDLGFTFYRSPAGFDHITKVSLIKTDGTVYQQVYGEKFDAPLMVDPLKDLVYKTGKSIFTTQGFVDRIRFYCTVYDPKANKYEFNYSIFVGMFAGVTVMLVPIVVLIGSILRIRRERLAGNKPDDAPQVDDGQGGS